MMKCAPLLFFAGLMHKESYYTADTLITGASQEVYGKLQECIGDAREVHVNVLEGDHACGSVDHRDPYLCDRTAGGGMIQDLGMHACTPLVALEPYFGKIMFNSLRVAYCDSYLNHARNILQLSNENIAETYGEMQGTTSKNVHIHIAVGKYVFGYNERSMRITGTKGVVRYDLTNNILVLEQKDHVPLKHFKTMTTPLLFAKKTETKFYPVLRSALEIARNNNPFFFDLNVVALRSQKYLLEAGERVPKTISVTYKKDAIAGNIFE